MLTHEFYVVCLRRLHAGDVIMIQAENRSSLNPVSAEISWLIQQRYIARINSGYYTDGLYKVESNFEPKAFVARLGTRLSSLKIMRQGYVSVCYYKDSNSALVGSVFGGISISVFPMQGKMGCYVADSELVENLSEYALSKQVHAWGTDSLNTRSLIQLPPGFNFQTIQHSLISSGGRLSIIPECPVKFQDSDLLALAA